MLFLPVPLTNRRVGNRVRRLDHQEEKRFVFYCLKITKQPVLNIAMAAQFHKLLATLQGKAYLFLYNSTWYIIKLVLILASCSEHCHSIPLNLLASCCDITSITIEKEFSLEARWNSDKRTGGWWRGKEICV